MSNRTRHGSVSAVVRLGALAATLLLVLLVSAAPAAVLKNKTTGETLKGTLTDQVINGLRVFLLADGGKKFLKMDEWEIVEADAPKTETPKTEEPKTETAPAETTATTPAKDTAPAKPTPPAEKMLVYLIPIKGPIMYSALITAVEKALKEAKTKKAGYVVFHLDTPGGRIDIGDKIITLIEGIDFAKTAAWVEGTETSGAISCGAYISLCTDGIYMAPGTSIGAAVPFHQRTTGSIEVDEKFQSYFRAKFRNLAEKHGHPKVVADAMVDSSVSVVQVFVDGQQQLVTEDDAKQLEEDHRSDGKFKRGKTVCRSGKILTMTAGEALEFGLCKAHAANTDELLDKLGLTNATVFEANWLPDQVKKQAEAKKKDFEKWRTQFEVNIEMAVQNDPRHQQYFVKDDMSFTDGGQRWRDYSDKCMVYLKKCAEAITALEKMSKEERTDYNLPEELFNDWKARLQAMWGQVTSERNSRKMP